MDPPTNKLLASEYARNAYHRLVELNVIEEGCCNPGDLGALADAVFQSKGSQEPLVNILRPQLDQAPPNAGHKIVAALMAERIVSLVLTVNFDRALDYAIVSVAPGAATISHSIADHAGRGRYGLIYLHSDVEAPADAWILRTSQIDGEWRESWQQHVVTELAQIPHVLFAGVGSPTPVITETLSLVRGAIPQGVTTYQVDAVERERNGIAQALNIPDGNYVQSRWATFMERVGIFAAKEFTRKISERYPHFCEENGLDADDPVHVLQSLPEGILEFGQLLAAWFLDCNDYKPFSTTDINLIVDIIRGISVVVGLLHADECVSDGTSVEIRKAGKSAGRVFSCSGSGTMYWAKAEAEMRLRLQTFRRRDKITPAIFITTGVQGMGAETPVPESLVPTRDAQSIAGSRPDLVYFAPETIKHDPNLLFEAFTI